MINSKINEFCKIVKSRSKENAEAFNLMIEKGYIGVAISLLRQELDSLIRVSYLHEKGITTHHSLNLINDFLDGKQWKKENSRGKKIRITDREMVNLAIELGGWIEIIYTFGSKLIHLSDIHGYKESDPFKNVSIEDKNSILNYLVNYHNYPYSTIDIKKLSEYLPHVMKKLIDNTEYYILEIEKHITSTRRGINYPDG